MKITVGRLRSIIRNVISEVAGGITLPRMPVIRNAMQPDFSDREQLGRISVKDADEEDSITPHLREPLYDEEEIWGPVPPTGEDPYALPDPYSKDYNVIPQKNIKR
jgi:hypothetical protein